MFASVWTNHFLFVSVFCILPPKQTKVAVICRSRVRRWCKRFLHSSGKSHLIPNLISQRQYLTLIWAAATKEDYVSHHSRQLDFKRKSIWALKKGKIWVYLLEKDNANSTDAAQDEVALEKICIKRCSFIQFETLTIDHEFVVST